MSRDPKVNALVKVEARVNKLEGTVDVFQDRPELSSDLSGSFIVLNNNEEIFTTTVSYPDGTGLYYQPFKRGLNPGGGIFGSPFLPIELNIIQTFEEASNLDDRFVSGTNNTRRAFLTEEGKYSDNALTYKRTEFTDLINIKWSGQRLIGLSPITTSIGAYSTISPNWQRPLSPSEPVQFQTGNLWIQQPIENLWQGDEVIWKLTSGSAFEQGNRVGRNLITGIVGPTTATLGLIPVIDGVRTTGSTVSPFGSDTSQQRFLEGGAIRDNSSSRTLGSHFRPANNSTIGERQQQTYLLVTELPYYDATKIEHSGRLQISTNRKLWDYQEYKNDLSRTDEQSNTINKFRSPEYVADIPPLKKDLICSVVTESGFISTRNGLPSSTDSLVDDNIFQKDYERNIWLPFGATELKIGDAAISSLSTKNKTFVYPFTGSFPKLDDHSTYLPTERSLYLGSPIRLYFGSLVPINATYANRFIPRDFGFFNDLVLLTSKGQVFLKRDLGFTDQDFSDMHFLDFSDPRIFFAQEQEVNSDGSSSIQIKDIDNDSLVEVVGAIGIFDYNATNSSIYESVALQYYKKSATRQFYFNATGHKAHLMNSEPYSYIFKRDNRNPARDPSFEQAEGKETSVWGYDRDEQILHAVDKSGVAKFYFTAYNTQYGKPETKIDSVAQITNLVTSFKSTNELTSDGNYIFPNAQSVEFNSDGNFPFLRQGFLKRYNILPENSEESINLQEIGFSQPGTSPVVRFSNKYNTKTDAFGNGYVSDIPEYPIPYFNGDGNVEALFGSSFKVKISDVNNQNQTLTNEVNRSLFRRMTVNAIFSPRLDSNADYGYAPYNPKEKIGVAYRNILSKPISQVSSSFVFYAPAYGGGNAKFLSFLPLPRIGTYNLISSSPVVNFVPNQYYWFKDPTTAAGGGITYNLSQLSSCALTSSNFIEYNDSIFKYPDSLVVSANNSDESLNGFSDFDNGIISQSINNKTKNKFNPLNSDIFINSSSNGPNPILGIFCYTKYQNPLANPGLTTSSISLNYFFDSIPNNSKIAHTSNGFSTSKFLVDESTFNSANSLYIKDIPIFSLEMQRAIRGFNSYGNSQDKKENKFAFACYTISDSESLYNGITFSSQSLFRSLSYIQAPAKGGGILNEPGESFLNIPLTQSNPGFYVGTEGASIAYINQSDYLRTKYDLTSTKKYTVFYQSNKFFIHPKGGLNYAIGPTDQYFGTAVLDESSNLRQITKKLSLYIENSLYQDTFRTDLNSINPLSTAYLSRGQRESTTGSLGGFTSGLFGVPAGTYTWVFNIQDMIPPLPVAAWIDSGTPPNLFSKDGKNGVDNGLRSSFYWNIPECEFNKSLVSGTVQEVLTDTEIALYGQFSGISGPDYSSDVLVSNLDSSTADFSLKISQADDLTFDPKPTAMNGEEQYKGVFVPDPSNPNLGIEGLNIEGSPSYELPNGEKSQPFKKIKVELQITKTMPMSSFVELCKLAVSYRPNSSLPPSIMDPQSSDGLSNDTWSPYPGEEYEDILRFNTGFSFDFARVSSICIYNSPYQVTGPASSPSISSVQFFTPPIINNVPYDVFSHDTNNTSPFIICDTETVNGVTNSLITYRTPLGYHSLLSFGESCNNFIIGDLTSSVDTFQAYSPSTNAYGVNRSIIDQGNSINIINLAGTAIKTETRED